MTEPAPADATVDPARNDPVLRLLLRVVDDNPVLAGVGFLVAAFGITAGLAKATDLARGTSHLTGLLADRQNLVNLLVVLPLGAAALVHALVRLREGVGAVLSAGTIRFASPEDQATWLRRFDDALNRRAFPWIALATAGAINTLFLYDVTDTWAAPAAGPQAWWFRVVAVVNTYLLAHLLLKALVTVRFVRRLFGGDRTVRLQPLHPDRCGGLRPLGAISIALNFFVGVVAIWLAVLAIVPGADGRTSMGFGLFVPTCIAYAGLALYLFLAPLSSAHRVMRAARTRELQRLHAEFQRVHGRLAASLDADQMDLDAARRLEVLENLHRVASAMPVWPFDVRIVAQLVGTMAVPPLVALFRALLRAPWG